MAELRKIPNLEGPVEIFPRKFFDDRGYFFESFREDWLQKMGIEEEWVQDNQSFSQKGTVRGLHFQREPFAQAKLVRVVSGKVLDVVVDLRKSSPTFGKTYTTLLDAERSNLFFYTPGICSRLCCS